MAVLTFYATANAVSVHQEISETDPGTEITAIPNTGWIGGTGLTDRSEFRTRTERASTTFDSTAYPDGSIDAVNGDCFRSTRIYHGDFAAGNWVLHFTVRANTAAGCSGKIHCRLFRGPNANGSGATEITSGDQAGTTVTSLATTVTQDSSVTMSLGAFSLNGEYLFVQLAWERTGAGSGATADINMRIGNTSSNGTRLITPDFTQVFIPGYYPIPCITGIGEPIDIINAALFTRHYLPQPFTTAGLISPTVWGEFAFGPGYVGKAYLTSWFLENIDQPVIFTLVFNELPPGLSLVTVGTTAAGAIRGYPTEPGSYLFTLLGTGPNSFAPKQFTIEILPFTFPIAYNGVPYNAEWLEGEALADTTTVLSGTLPPGLVLQHDRIVGIPSESGVFPFQLQMHSVALNEDYVFDFSIIVEDDPTPGGDSGFIHGN